MQLTDTVSPYLITPGERQSVMDLITFQQRYNQVLKKPVPENYDDYFANVEWIANSSWGIVNTNFRAWITAYYTMLTEQAGFNKMFLINKFRHFCLGGADPTDEPNWHMCDPWRSYWYTFYNGWYWRDLQAGDLDHWIGPAFDYPGTPPVWKADLDRLKELWRGTPPPASEVDPGPVRSGKEGEYAAFADKTIRKWMPVLPDIHTKAKPLWDNQLKAAQDMMAVTTLPAADHFFLLYMLIALPTGERKSWDLAKKLTEQSAQAADGSTDSFVNYLLLVIVLHLSKTERMNSGQINDFLRRHEDMLVIPPAPAVEALKPAHDCLKTVYTTLRTGLELQRSLLNSDASYPYSDMDFDARMNDTIRMLNAMRNTCKPVTLKA